MIHLSEHIFIKPLQILTNKVKMSVAHLKVAPLIFISYYVLCCQKCGILIANMLADKSLERRRNDYFKDVNVHWRDPLKNVQLGFLINIKLPNYAIKLESSYSQSKHSKMTCTFSTSCSKGSARFLLALGPMVLFTLWFSFQPLVCVPN